MVSDLVTNYPNHFEKVKKLICNFENMKRTTAPLFVASLKNITHLEIGRRNVGLYRHLKTYDVKVRVLKAVFPVKQLVDQLYDYLLFVKDEL